ncbi:MAG: hypothetical protein AAF572_19495 [Cyanobacteria bacterium P01_B01_bin.77]
MGEQNENPKGQRARTKDKGLSFTIQMTQKQVSNYFLRLVVDEVDAKSRYL